jgi:hypothetical protein
LIAIALAFVFMLFPAEPDTFAIGEVTLVETSLTEQGMHIEFRVPEGESCPGIWIESEGTMHFVSFARTIGDNSPLVDIPCETATELTKAGHFSVLVPAIRPLAQAGDLLQITQIGPVDTKVIFDLSSLPDEG